MTGEELYRIRKDLGDAIGRSISTSDMAKLCGLAPKNGSDTIKKWENGEGPSGPVAAYLELLQIACSTRWVGPDMLRGAAVACQRFGIDFRGGMPATEIFRSMLIEEIRRRLIA